MKFSLSLLLAALAPSADAQIGIHGSGTTNPSKCYWHIMDQIQTQIKLPTKMTYRAVGSSTGQAEFIGSVTASDNDFGSGDIPLSADDYDLFPASSILHLPIVLGAIGFFHSVPTGDQKLNLTPCVMAKILNRDIVDWTDAEIVELNPNLSLPSPYPITVAHRVQGSSSTSSITQYLNQACPSEWPDTLVGKTINWKSDTKGCEGSAGMTDCINSVPGTIGYIDAGHGHSEGLQEVELRNLDGFYVSSFEANQKGGIMSATDSAGLPTELDGSFADVNLLNQAGAATWPIVALSYIYVRKDITYIQDPASQALLKAFLRALYTEEYITECEEEFGFVRVTGDLRQKALDAIDALVTTADAPEFTFEFATDKRVGQGDYVISSKRQSYSEVEQDSLVSLVAALQKELRDTNAKIDAMGTDSGSSNEHGHEGGDDANNGSAAELNNADIFDNEAEWEEKESQLKTALALASVSFILWMLALIFIIVKQILGL